MIVYVIIIVSTYLTYTKYFTGQYLKFAVRPETLEKFGLSKASKLNLLYRKSMQIRFKYVAISFVINLIILIIYTPVVFVLFFVLDNKKIVEFVSLGVMALMVIIEETPINIIIFYDDKLERRRKRYFKALEKLYEIEEKKAKEKEENDNKSLK